MNHKELAEVMTALSERLAGVDPEKLSDGDKLRMMAFERFHVHHAGLHLGLGTTHVVDECRDLLRIAARCDLYDEIEAKGGEADGGMDR